LDVCDSLIEGFHFGFHLVGNCLKLCVRCTDDYGPGFVEIGFYAVQLLLDLVFSVDAVGGVPNL